MCFGVAKRVFGLTQTDVESLRIECIQNSPKRFVSADDAEALAKRKYEFFHGPGSGVNYVSPVNIWNSYDLTHTKRENNGRRTKTNWGIHSCVPQLWHPLLTFRTDGIVSLGTGATVATEGNQRRRRCMRHY